MVNDMPELLRSVVDHEAGLLAHLPIESFGPQVDDLTIPKAGGQDDDDPQGVSVGFGRFVRHQLRLWGRLGLPEWLRVHRAGHQAIIGALISSDFVLPLEWCWPEGPATGMANPQRQRIIMITLNDGSGMALLQRDNGEKTHVPLPPPPDVRWLASLHQSCVTYLSHQPSVSIVGDTDRFGRSK